MSTNFWQAVKKPILALAPMAGITDSGFRSICKQFGADVLYTEMVSAAGLCYDSRKTSQYLKFKKSERPIVAQLFGSQPEQFARAAQIVTRAGFNGIDINFGCPARKVVKNESGASLMDNLNKAYDIIAAVCNNTSLPVSIKIRNSKGQTTATQLVKTIRDLPVQAIMIHGRSFEQGFHGEPDWEEIKKVRQIYPGILLANGQIDSPEKAKQVLALTATDGLGLAQGACGRPWLFKQIKNYLAKNKYSQPNWQTVKKIILKHAKLAVLDKNNLIEFRKHLLWYVKGHPQAKQLKAELITINNLGELKMVLKKY